jgi:hypothetical protein
MGQPRRGGPVGARSRGRAAGKSACTNSFAGTPASVLRFDRQRLGT